MTNITQETWNFLRKNPAIEKNLADEIINTRALANYIIKEEKLSATTHSVISAIRRYKTQERKKVDRNIIADVLRNSKISTKSRLFLITISRDFNFLAKTLPQILDSIDVTKGELLRMAEGRESMKILIDNVKRDEIIEKIPQSRIFETEENIGEINIRLDDRKGDTPGLVSAVLNEIAANDINIIEIIGCLPEIILIVKENDISRTHETLLKFFYGD